MIFTNGGSEVKITARQNEYNSLTDVNFGAEITIRYKSGVERYARACDLKADGGLREIAEAVFSAPVGAFCIPDISLEPKPIKDDGSCDPLYGRRMDSADLGEN